ncbi:hypothetical protein B0H10DRAFT_1078443 [Mycena sp. CBHHK59/15]|nr:hypothetical protein B0H10DRAFT_1078443 [Mycena sp. CBHHK59/15]
MSRHSLFAVFFLLFWCREQSVQGAQVNVTVDDSDPPVLYNPSTSWNSNQVVCTSCNNPPSVLALRDTYHKGVHLVAVVDEDDGPNGGRAVVLAPRTDEDDPNFSDTPVTAQLNFTGTAVYIYCIQPLGASVAPQPPTLMNITFSLDDRMISTFVHQGSPTASGFRSGVNVFAQKGLSDGPHALRLSLGPNSALILDYVIYTQNTADPPPSSLSQTSTRSAALNASSPPAVGDVTNDETTKKGTVSFAGAVAGSLGVLGILCFGTAFSIYWRRLLAARRERLERGGENPPAMMVGPASFVPRYFPGTVLPSIPPPYATSESSHHTTLVSASEPLLSIPNTGSQTYADIPPPLDELVPPSFGVALTTPAVTILSGRDSSAGASTPRSRPPSWNAVPHMMALPSSRASSSRATSLYSGDELV